MHMRTKKWARPELQACPFFIDAIKGPDAKTGALRGTWRPRFANPDLPLHIEMGCGKAVSTAKMIADNPEINFVAADLSADILGVARRNIVDACGENPGNVQLVMADICFVEQVFGPQEPAERIYIHFCNPWTEHPKHEKRRLTHPRQLMQYRTFLKEGGEIWFKTDDDTLFEDSLAYFDLCGFEPVKLGYDLHADGFRPNYISEHEEKYTALGVPIKYGVFRMKPETPDFDPTRFRLTPGIKKEAIERMNRAVMPSDKEEK